MFNSVLRCYEYLHQLINVMPLAVRSFFYLVLGVVGLTPMVNAIKDYLE